METLELSNLVFEVRRSPKRSTLGLTVDRGGELVIHAPEEIDCDELSRWTRAKLLWVHRKLIRKTETAPTVREPEFVSGESFSYLGKMFRLKIVRQTTEPFRFDGRNFLLNQSARQGATEHFKRWYIDVGSAWLSDRMTLLGRRLGVQPAHIHVRDLGYRWGSCGKSRVVYFNWKLMQLPPRLIDYVITHELAHLLEPNHGPGLWRILDRSLPDWRGRAQELAAKAPHTYWLHRKK